MHEIHTIGNVLWDLHTISEYLNVPTISLPECIRPSMSRCIRIGHSFM